MIDDVFVQRTTFTEQIVQRIRQALQEQLGERQSTLIGDHTCIYATGSCGRGEMSAGSDLDAYLVRVTDEGSDDDATTLEAAVEHANRVVGLPELDGGGKYLEMARVGDLLDLLGSPRDDSEGLLTKRVLLLLESRVLLGEDAHRTLIDRVIHAYWINEHLHTNDYLPFMLVNDIVRYWRIVLLNHESRLRKLERKIQADTSIMPEEKDSRLLAERRYRSYKLRLPRCLTCFSALTYLLALTPRTPAHVSKDDVRRMIQLTPLDRLRRLPELAGCELPEVAQLLSVYRCYLQRTEVDKGILLERLQHDKTAQVEIPREGRMFTELMFRLVEKLGGGRPLHRHMLV